MLDAKGVMEPWQEPRSGRGWFVLVLGIVVFAAFGGVVGYAYFKGLPGIGGEPPLIRAEAGPYRVAPEDRGGLAISNANSRIVTVLGDKPDEARVERILPPESSPAFEASEPEPMVGMPEQTDEQPGRLAATEPSVGGELGSAVPDVMPAADALAMPYPRSKPAPSEAESQSEPAETEISALPTPPPAVEPPAPEAAAPAPEPPAASPPPPAPSTATATATATAPAAPGPRTLTPAPAQPQATPPAAPRQLVRTEPTAPPAAAPPAAAPLPRTSTGAGVFRLQLAAVRSEGGLTQAWADLRQRYPAALGSVTPQVERTDTTSGPLYRLQAGPFSNREAAANACGSIRADGGQCFIVGPIAQ